VSFNPSVPNRGDFLAISQKQLLSNWNAMYNAFLVDHVSLTANDNSGRHDVLTLRPQATDPTTSSTQSAIYNKLDANNQPQLFFRPDTNQTPIQLTNSNLNTLQTGGGSSQSSFLAGPFTIYFGFIVNCPNSQIVTLTPSSTLLYVGLTTNLNGNVPVGLASTAAAISINLNQFTVSYNATSGGITTPPTIYYMAIGK